MKNAIQSQFIKFLIVGGLGTLTNLVLFFLFVDVLKYHPIPIAVGAFIISAVQNYILNHYWTFAVSTQNRSANVLGLTKFILIALIGLAVNLLFLMLIISIFNPQLKVVAQAFGIAAAAIFNYFGSKMWVFKHE